MQLKLIIPDDLTEYCVVAKGDVSIAAFLIKLIREHKTTNLITKVKDDGVFYSNVSEDTGSKGNYK